VAGRAAALWRDMEALGYASGAGAPWGRAVRGLCATVSEAWKGVAVAEEGGWAGGPAGADGGDGRKAPAAGERRPRGRGRGGVDGDADAWKQTASGRIFEKHGWNAIDSRWRAF